LPRRRPARRSDRGSRAEREYHDDTIRASGVKRDAVIDSIADLPDLPDLPGLLAPRLRGRSA
jgi:hypothetical protein